MCRLAGLCLTPAPPNSGVIAVALRQGFFFHFPLVLKISFNALISNSKDVNLKAELELFHFDSFVWMCINTHVYTQIQIHTYICIYTFPYTEIHTEKGRKGKEKGIISHNTVAETQSLSPPPALVKSLALLTSLSLTTTEDVAPFAQRGFQKPLQK